MSFTLTGKEIIDLAIFAGLSIDKNSLGEDELETEFTLMACPKEGVLDEDDMSRTRYASIAYISEYPEEGCMPLGDAIEVVRQPQDVESSGDSE